MKFTLTITTILLAYCTYASSLPFNKQDTLLPSEHKFKSKEVYVPKVSEEVVFVTLFMDYMVEGKKLTGFLHKDELMMLEGENLTEKKMQISQYEIVSVGKRMAQVKTYNFKTYECKTITLRYYKNMYGHVYGVPGKSYKFERKMGDITLKKTYYETWTSASKCAN